MRSKQHAFVALVLALGVVATLLLLRDRKSSSPSDNSTMAENARDSVDITDLPNSAPLSGTLPGKAAIRVRLSHNALTDSELKRKKVRIMC
jgi:hypothetical protein